MVEPSVNFMEGGPKRRTISSYARPVWICCGSSYVGLGAAGPLGTKAVLEGFDAGVSATTTVVVDVFNVSLRLPSVPLMVSPKLLSAPALPLAALEAPAASTMACAAPGFGKTASRRRLLATTAAVRMDIDPPSFQTRSNSLKREYC